MSRIGKKPVQIPSDVQIQIQDKQVMVKGKKGTLEMNLHPSVSVTQQENEVIVSVSRPEDTKESAIWGTSRKLIANMVEGVTEGFSKQLELHGVGFKVAASGNGLTLHVGYSHPVNFKLPEGIQAAIDKNTITLTGIDKQLVGETAAQIRKIRKPEPYQGKGIRYAGEQLRRKSGKSAKTA